MRRERYTDQVMIRNGMFGQIKYRSETNEINKLACQRISMRAREKVLAKNQLLYCQGDEARSAYLVKSGLIQQSIYGNYGKNLITNFVGENQLCGELELITKRTRVNSAVSHCSTTVYEVPLQLLIESFSCTENGVDSLILHCCKGALSLHTRVERQALRPMSIVLLESLLELSNQFRSEDIYLNHQSLADYVGITREYVSKLLSAYAEKGLIKTARNCITLVNKNELSKEISLLSNYI